ncbi:hypothetical protein H0H87_012456 [Tephrocybe sp. NHM501043]|nr:hypothetical protein H0H87_012456 [Tephrocybe sp. NHM501043]
MPPFVVVGIASEPFLARVELQFGGVPGQNGEVTEQIVHLEHWVELDLLKSATPILGEEQMVDIELDKKTILLPLQKGYPAIGAKAQWFQGSEILQVIADRDTAKRNPTKTAPKLGAL